MRHWLPSHAGTRASRAGTVTKRRARDRRFAALALVAALMGSGIASVLSQQADNRASALATGQTVDLRVLLIGAPGGATDPTTSAWAAGLTTQGVAYKEIDGTGALGSATISLPLASLESSTPHGLYNAVVFAGKPGDFAAGQFTNLFAYESAFGIRQLDGNFVPPSGGALGLTAPTVADPSTGAGISTTTPIPALTAAGLTTFPALAGPVAIDTGTFGAPDALGTVPTGATQTPMVKDAAGNVLVGVYHHPATGDPQAGVDEMTINFNYNQFMTQWLLLGPGLINWVTGATHLGLYRNYSTLHVDDVFAPDDRWDTTTHANDYNPADALRMRDVDVTAAAAWEKANNYRLDMLFNGGSSPANATPAVADPLLKQFQTVDPGTGKPYTQDFGWLNHTWDHAYLDVGCATTNYIEAEVQQNTNWAASAASGTTGLGGLGLTSTADNSVALGAQNPTTLVPGGHSGFANLAPGNAGAVDPPDMDDPAVASGGSLSAGTYTYALTDQFNASDSPSLDQSSASVTTAFTVTANQQVTLSWPAVCHAANYLVYRKIGNGDWRLIGNLPTPAVTNPPATLTADPTGGSTTNTTGGGMQVQSYVDNAGPTAGTDEGATFVPPTTQDALETPWEQNPNFLTALNALGMTSVGTDASKPYPNPPTSLFGIGVTYTGATYPASSPFPDGNFEGVPRHPINIFYNNSTETQAVDEYNTLYVVPPAGHCVNTTVTTCLATPAKFSDIVSSVDTGMFANLVNNDPRPTYVHQTNLMGTAPATIPATPPATSPTIGDGLLYSVLNPLLTKYHTFFNATVPIQQPTMGAIGTILSQQAGWATAQPPGTASTANSVAASQTGSTLTIKNNGTAPVAVPVTVPTGSTIGAVAFGSAYGGALSAWQTIAAGATVTITVPFTATATTGMLRVTTSPALPSQIIVDGTPSDSWGLAWVHLAPGSHTVSFTHIEGYTDPAPQTVTVTAGVTTTVTGTFTQRGTLRVITSPAVPSTISVDGIPRDDWGMWTDIPAGSHQVCFGAVPGHTTPACQTATVTAGALTTITGTFATSTSTTGPTGGMLRVTTSPALPSQILIDGNPADSWGLAWVHLPAGTHTVSFTHIEGYTDPAPQTVTITNGATTTVTGTFTQRGTLRVITSPAVPSTISVDGIPRDDYGMWTDIPAGSHQVCFGAVTGLTAPACQTATVTAGALTTITGTFT